jgi:putative addiction module component (TIGR02574 family)
MATALAELEEKVRALSQSDKAALIRLLIGELDGPPEPDIERAWIAEAKRRHQELLEGRVKGIPVEQVFSNVRALLAR